MCGADGLPLTARLENRECGVWIVDIETGETMGFLRFDDVVEEIFDVALLPGIRFPDVLEPGALEAMRRHLEREDRAGTAG